MERILAIALAGKTTLFLPLAVHEKRFVAAIANSVEEMGEQREESYLIVVVTQPLSRDGDMAEDYGAPEARQLSRAWARGCRDIESCQRASGAKSL